MSRHRKLPGFFFATLVVPAVVPVLSVPARAAIQVQVTYTDGEILAGPLSFGLSALPASVTATIVLHGSTTTSEFFLDDVISLSLVLGDAHFTETDLHSLSIVPGGRTGRTGPINTFTTLSYRLGGAAGSPLADYDPLVAIAPDAVSDPVSSSTSTVDGRLAGNGNFALDIFGVDKASREIVHDHYRTSEQLGTLVSASVPEPTAFFVWSLLGITCGCGRRHWSSR
jgi:hypothetical protein